MSNNAHDTVPKLKAQSLVEKMLRALVNKTPLPGKAPIDAPVEFPVQLPERATSPTQVELPTATAVEDAATAPTSDMQLIENVRRYILGSPLPRSVPPTNWLAPGTHAGNDMALDMLRIASSIVKCDNLKENVVDKWEAAGSSGAMSNPRMGAEFLPTADGTKRTGAEQGSSLRNEPGFNVSMAGKSGAVVQPYVFVVATTKDGKLAHGVKMYTHSTTMAQDKVAEIVANEMLPKDMTLVFFVLFNTSNDGMHRGMTTYDDDGTDVFAINNGTDMALVDVSWANTAFDPANVARLSGSGTDSFAADFVKMANAAAAKPARPRRGKAVDPEEAIKKAAEKFCKAQQMAVTTELVAATTALIEDRNAAMALDGAKQSAVEAAFVDAWTTPGFVASMLTGRRQTNRRFAYVVQEAAEKHGIDVHALDKEMLKTAVHYAFLKPTNRRNKFWSLEFDDDEHVIMKGVEADVSKTFDIAEFDEAEGVEAACNIIYGEPVSGVGSVRATTLAATVSNKTLAVRAFLAGLTAPNVKEQASDISALYFYLCQLQSPNDYGTLPDGVMPEAYHDALLSALVAVAALMENEIPSVIVDATLGQLVVSPGVRTWILTMAHAHVWSGPVPDAIRAIANIYAAKVGATTTGLVDPAPPPSSSHPFSPPHEIGTLGAVKNIVARIAVAAYDPKVAQQSTKGTKVVALAAAVIQAEQTFTEFWSRPAKRGGLKLPSTVNIGDITGKFGSAKDAAIFGNSSDKLALLFGLSAIMAPESLDQPGCIFDVQKRIGHKIAKFVAFMRPSDLDDSDSEEDAAVSKKTYRIVTRLMQPMLAGLQLHQDPAACIPEGTTASKLVAAFIEMKNKPRPRPAAAAARRSAKMSRDTVEDSSSDDDSDEDSDNESVAAKAAKRKRIESDSEDDSDSNSDSDVSDDDSDDDHNDDDLNDRKRAKTD